METVLPRWLLLLLGDSNPSPSFIPAVLRGPLLDSEETMVDHNPIETRKFG
jgi:hypothetical protein